MLGFSAAFGFAASAAAATNGELLTGFNAIISNNFSTSSESEGPILVGGTLSGSGTVQSFGTPLPTGLTGFGSINVGGGTSGASYNANNLAVKIATPNQGATFSGASSVTYGASFPVSVSSIWSQLGALSGALQGLATTSGSSLSGGTFTAGAATVAGVSNVAVLNITSAQLQAVGNPTMNLGSAQILIINVDASATGGSYSPAGGTNFNGQNYAGSVLWNFYNATSITLGVEFGGSILAPNATVQSSSPIDGALVAKNYVGTSELHYKPLGTKGTTLVNSFGSTPVPEPASLALLGSALAGLGLARRRRARQAAR